MGSVNQGPVQNGRWYVCLAPRPRPALRLFCFPYAGGSLPAFSRWPQYLSESVELWVANLPGRAGRLNETPLTSLVSLTQALSRAFLPFSSEPYVLFGHSLGSRLAFELARSMRRQGRRQPCLLIASAGGAPQLPRNEEPIHTLPKSDFVAELRKRFGLADEVVAHEEFLELLLPMLRADFAVYETAVYAPEPPLDAPITVFGGCEDDLVSREELLAWRLQTSGAFREHWFDGGHFFLRGGEAEVVAVVETEIQRACRA